MAHEHAPRLDTFTRRALEGPWRVPYIRPVFPDPDLIADDLRDIVGANWYTNFGPFEQRFAAAIEDYLGGSRHVVTVNNATSGLMAVAKLLLPEPGPQPGLVLVASYTFAAGPEAVRWCGHQPCFIDIDATTLQPSLASARRALDEHGERVVGIMLTNSFGIGNAEIGDWEALADERGLPLIIDSAAGFGSQYPDGKPVGVAGTCEVFSFHATKTFAIGEGGAVVCRDADLAADVKSFTNFGFVQRSAEVIGLNGKLQELNAAIGLRQLVRLPDALAGRRGSFAALKDALSREGARLTFPGAQESSSLGAAVALAETPRTRDAIYEALTEARVEVRKYYSPPVHEQKPFAGDPRADDLAHTADVTSRVLNLPVHEDMQSADIDLIASTIARAT